VTGSNALLLRDCEPPLPVGKPRENGRMERANPSTQTHMHDEESSTHAHASYYKIGGNECKYSTSETGGMTVVKREKSSVDNIPIVNRSYVTPRRYHDPARQEVQIQSSQ